MSKKVYTLIVVLLIVIIAAGILYYRHPRQTSEELIGVIVTILPQAEFVEKVAGDRVKVTVMIPPGASPHTYEPTPSQLSDVSKAQIYFKVGSGVEFEETWSDKIVAMNPDVYIIDGSKGIKIIDKDPHIWNSPVNAKIMVENFYLGLIEVDPNHKNEYEANKDVYINDLNQLDIYIRDIFSKYENKAFLIYHPAFGYFAKEYGLTQILIEHEGKEPTPKVLQKCIDHATEYDVSYVYVAPQFTTKHAETIAKEIGGQTLLIDPLPRSYISNMRSVAESLSLEFE